MRLTSTAPVRRHLDMLREHDLGTRRVAQLAGVSRTAVENVRRNEHMYPATAAAILAVRPQELARRHQVDATGTARRMKALVALGWSFRAQASRAGANQDVWRRYTDVRNVLRRSEEAVKAVYDELSMRRPEGRSAVWSREYARRWGWFPPMAWDDEVIDSPEALPCLLPPVAPVDRDLELLVQHVVAGHPVEPTWEARREIVRRMPEAKISEVAQLARCTKRQASDLRVRVKAT